MHDHKPLYTETLCCQGEEEPLLCCCTFACLLCDKQRHHVVEVSTVWKDIPESEARCVTQHCWHVLSQHVSSPFYKVINVSLSVTTSSDGRTFFTFYLSACDMKQLVSSLQPAYWTFLVHACSIYVFWFKGTDRKTSLITLNTSHSPLKERDISSWWDAGARHN